MAGSEGICTQHESTTPSAWPIFSLSAWGHQVHRVEATDCQVIRDFQADGVDHFDTGRLDIVDDLLGQGFIYGVIIEIFLYSSRFRLVDQCTGGTEHRGVRLVAGDGLAQPCLGDFVITGSPGT